MKFNIKLATIEDLTAMQMVGSRLFDHEIKVHRAKEFFEDPRHHLVLAYHEDQVVGMASGFEYVHPDKDPILFINEVAVLEKFRNNGIGRKVVRFLFEHAKAIGCTEAWLATENSNIAARKSFVAAGGLEEEEPIVLINFEISK